MVYYDCEGCKRHITKGGKCKKFVHNCPFKHLKQDIFNSQEEIDKDIETAIELKNDLKQLITKHISKFNGNCECWYSEFFEPVIDAYDKLKALTEEELIKEWKRINN